MLLSYSALKIQQWGLSRIPGAVPILLTFWILNLELGTLNRSSLSPITYYLSPIPLDTGIRLKAFQFLEQQCKLHGDVLPRKVLAEGRSGSPATSLWRGLVLADF